jgi:hypothetical protein
MTRGIISNRHKIDGINGSGGYSFTSISREELSYYLLYWDRIVFPSNTFMHFGLPDEEKLLSLNAIERPRMAVGGAFNPSTAIQMLFETQGIVANQLIENEKSVDWVIHQVGDEIYLPKYGTEKDSLRLELLNCLPVPKEISDFEEILNFKVKRNDELGELRDSLDYLYLEILNSGDPKLSKLKAFEKLENSINSLNKTTKEWFKSFSGYGFTVELNLNGKDFGMALLGGAALDSFVNGFTIPIASISVLAGILNLKVSKTLTVDKSDNKLKLGYLTRANKKRII